MTEVAAPSGAAATQEAGSSPVTGAPAKRVYVPSPPEPSKPQAEAPTLDFKGTKHKVVIEGQEYEVDYDELKRDYQTSKVATKRLQEAARLQKESQQVLQALERGDVDFIVDRMGPDKARKLFEDHLIKQLEWEQMDPRDRRAIEAERQAEAAKQELKTRDEREKEAQNKVLVTQVMREIDTELGGLLKNFGAKDPSMLPHFAARLTDLMAATLDAKTPLKGERLLNYAVEGFWKEFAEFAPRLPVQELMRRIPPEVLKMIREHEVNQVMGEKSQRRTRSPQAAQPDKKMSLDDWFKQKEQKRR